MYINELDSRWYQQSTFEILELSVKQGDCQNATKRNNRWMKDEKLDNCYMAWEKKIMGDYLS
jgi:hypothetical protein